MHETPRNEVLKSEAGFTLIELLTATGIIAILASIAVSVFTSERQTAFNTMAKESLRLAIHAQEALFIDNDSYSACTSSADCQSVLDGFEPSQGVEISFTVPSANNFVGTARHAAGTITWEFDNSVGSFIER